MDEQCDGREGLEQPGLTCVESTTRPRCTRAFVMIEYSDGHNLHRNVNRQLPSATTQLTSGDGR